MIDRVATSSQSALLLSQILQNEHALLKSQQQVSTGKIASSYVELGDKAAVLEAARSASARASAVQSSTQLALAQSDLQDMQVTSLADLADQLRQSLNKTLADNDASTLMAQAQSIFDQASQILNAKDANGNYLYAGEKASTPPVTVTSLADLAALTSSDEAFGNGSLKKSVNVGGGQMIEVGMLASDLGKPLFDALREIARYHDDVNGPFEGTLSTDQSSFLSTQVRAAQTASQTLNNKAAANGFTYNHLSDVIDRQKTLSTLYKSFVSDLEDVDMGTAITNLNQNQVALQAAVQVTARLNQVSLLNYLPIG